MHMLMIMVLQFHKKYVLMPYNHKKDNKVEKEQEKKQQATEEPTTVGRYLQMTRLKQKKTIEGAAKALCIRKIYIKAIEEDNFQELPPVPYGIGFVRSYAAYLGLNVDRIVQCYKEEALPKKHINTKQVVKSHAEAARPNKNQILFGLLGLILLYAGWLTYHNVFMAAEPEETVAEVVAVEPQFPAVEVEEIITEESAEVEAEAIEEPVAAENETAEEETVVEEEAPQNRGMTVKFNGESWIEIRDAEKIYITGIYQKGFEYQVPDKRGLIFSVGKQQNVDVYIDGKLTKITRPKKQTKIELDQFLNH